MPTPIGHVLGGLAAGWLVAGRSTAARAVRARSSWWAHARDSRAALFGAIGAAPDIDLLFGTHSTYTHSVGAVACTAVAALLWTRGRHPRLAAACAAAVASHALLDWLGSDTTPPLGVMALWPLSSDYYFSNAFFFEAISRRYWLDHFITQKIWAGTKKKLILRPPPAAGGWWGRP